MLKGIPTRAATQGHNTDPNNQRSRIRRCGPALTLANVLLLVLLGAIWLKREGLLPETPARIVREVEAVALDPLLAELGFEVPGERPPAAPGERIDVAEARALLAQVPVRPDHHERGCLPE